MERCKVECCERRVEKAGLCLGHYRRRRRGDASETPIRRWRADPPDCSVGWCDNPAYCKGFCAGHYSRSRSGKDMDKPFKPRSVGDGARQRAYKGYVLIKRGGVWVREHRAVMEEVLGRRLSAAETVHHINGNRADNRPENLELWVASHTSGQRVGDVVEWVVREYPEYVEAALAGRAQLRLAG